MRLFQTVKGWTAIRALSLGALLLGAGVWVDQSSDASPLRTKAKLEKTKASVLAASRTAKLTPTPPPPPEDTVQGNPYAKLVVKNLGKVLNTDAEDFGPTITADGRTLFFVSRRSGGKGGDDFWVSQNPMEDDTTWSAPNNVGDINTDKDDGAASIAADGQTIYFSSSKNTTEKNDINLWEATLEGRTWKNIKEVGSPVNTTAWETHPSISPDGKRLFFASNRPGKIGPDKKSNVDIFMSRKLADGRWTNPVNLGSKINSAGYDGTPFIAADGTTLYFASDGRGGLGEHDLFMSEWVGPSDTDWTVAKPLPAPINSVSSDMFLTIPASGNVLYFASTRDDKAASGKLDLYVATNPPPPKATLVLRGVAYDVNTKEKLGAHVVVTDEQTGDTVYNKFANSATGEYLVVLSSNSRGELGGSYLVSATEPNHFPYPPTAIRVPLRKDTSRIITHDIPMNNEEPPVVRWITTPPALLMERPSLYPGFKGVIIREQQTIELFALLPMVFFDQGIGTLPNRYVLYSSPADTEGFTEDTLSSTLNSYYNYLNILGQRLRRNDKATIRLTGTNSQEAANEKSVELSRQRADFVKKYLVEIWGIAPSRISVEARNLPENSTLSTTPEGIEENRRVEVVSDEWEIIRPVLFKQNVKVPDHRTVRFGMINGLREEVIKSRELIISHNGKPWNTITNLGPISQKESGEWNWRNTSGKLPDDETPMQVQLKITDNTGREVLSNVDEVGVRQFTTKQMVAQRIEGKTREIYNLILFKYNSSDMGKWNRKILETYVYDRIQPNSDVAIGGYTDILGTKEYNEKLSTNRANAVKGDISGRIKGKAASLTSHGYGKDQPLYMNELPEGRYYNRTVQVLVESPITDAP